MNHDEIEDRGLYPMQSRVHDNGLETGTASSSLGVEKLGKQVAAEESDEVDADC